jgi:hypothetical protein
VVADLPVGENLQDQVMADGIEFFTPYTGFTVTAARAENFLSAWGYSLFGTGNVFQFAHDIAVNFTKDPDFIKCFLHQWTVFNENTVRSTIFNRHP